MTTNNSRLEERDANILALDKIDKGIAHIALVLEVDGEVEEVVRALVALVDGSQQHALAVLVGDVLDHQRCPLVCPRSHTVNMEYILGFVFLLSFLALLGVVRVGLGGVRVALPGGVGVLPGGVGILLAGGVGVLLAGSVGVLARGVGVGLPGGELVEPRGVMVLLLPGHVVGLPYGLHILTRRLRFLVSLQSFACRMMEQNRRMRRRSHTK